MFDHIYVPLKDAHDMSGESLFVHKGLWHPSLEEIVHLIIVKILWPVCLQLEGADHAAPVIHCVSFGCLLASSYRALIITQVLILAPAWQ